MKLTVLSVGYPFAAVGSDAAGGASFSNHNAPATLGNSAGEPSIGVDWNPNAAEFKHDKVNTGGVAFFSANGDSLASSLIALGNDGT